LKRLLIQAHLAHDFSAEKVKRTPTRARTIGTLGSPIAAKPRVLELSNFVVISLRFVTPQDQWAFEVRRLMSAIIVDGDHPCSWSRRCVVRQVSLIVSNYHEANDKEPHQPIDNRKATHPFAKGQPIFIGGDVSTEVAMHRCLQLNRVGSRSSESQQDVAWVLNWVVHTKDRKNVHIDLPLEFFR
jgi:hypothetical protein